MQRQRKTRYKDKKDKEYRETGKTPAMCAGIFLSILADWFDQKRCDVYSALPGTHVVSVISNPGFLANCLSCTSRTINAMLVNEHSVSIWDLFPTENPRGALHWQMFIIQIVNAFNVNWLKDLVLNGNKILVRLRGSTTRRASPCWTTSTPTARSVLSSFVTRSMLYSKTASWMSCLSTTLMSFHSSLSLSSKFHFYGRWRFI